MPFDYLNYCDGLIYPREKMLPMTSLHLLVSFGGAVKVFDAFRAKPVAMLTESWVIGVWSVCHIADGRSNIRFFGVCFKPGAAYPFLQLPLSELHNQLTGADLESGLVIYNGRFPDPAEHGVRTIKPEDVCAPALYRLYQAVASEHWVLDPGAHPDHRTPVRMPVTV